LSDGPEFGGDWYLLGALIVCASLLAVDGDTIRCNGVNMRDMGDGRPFVSAYDTPETGSRAKCNAERRLGETAKRRMQQLLATPGVQIIDSGQRDKTSSRRPLVWIKLKDGRSIGSVMISEGLARRWTPNYRPNWC
jgi:micrococcal nuclease